MALTKTASAASSTSPKTAPNSITTVTTNVNPSGQGAWTTSAPYVIYTAPSDCLYARIVIPYKMKKSSSSYNNYEMKVCSYSNSILNFLRITFLIFLDKLIRFSDFFEKFTNTNECFFETPQSLP